MANGILPNEALPKSLSRLLVNADTLAIPWQCLLFTNNYVPVAGTTLVSLTEPSWGSYSRRTIDPLVWTSPTLVGDTAQADYGVTPFAFQNVGGTTQTVYGYALYDIAFGIIMLAERFEPGDIRAIASGEQVMVLPRYSIRSQSPTE